MKNRTFQIVGLIILGFIAQEIAASQGGADWAVQTFPELTRQAGQAATRGGWFRGWVRPSMPSVSMPSISMPSMPSLPSFSSASGQLPSMEGARSLGNRAWQGVTSFGQQYTPSLETVKAAPARLWSGVGSLYEKLPTRGEALDSARAFSELAWGGAKAAPATIWSGVKATPGAIRTGLTYPGSAVMSAGSGIGSLWGSYAPQTVQQTAGQLGQYLPSSPAWLSNMTDENKQAALGLAALLAAGYLAKQGYNRWSGPSAYNEFMTSMDQAIAPMLLEYANAPKDYLLKSILDTIGVHRNGIKGAVKAGTLSLEEADSLIADLLKMNDQLTVITEIYAAIAKLIDTPTFDVLNYNSLLNGAVRRSKILTADQKNALEARLINIVKVHYTQK
jgi:hypothetical protein